MMFIKKLFTSFVVLVSLLQFNSAEAKESKVEIKTITYSPEMQADLFSPHSKKPVPAVILIHGGYWTGGSRNELSDFATKLAQKGFFAMTVDYHLLPKYNQQSQTKDVINAILWLKENSKQLGINPSKIGVVGISAGGYLAAWAATHDEVLNGLHSLPNAVVSLYGPWDLTEEASKEVAASSIQLVEKFCAGQNRTTVSPIYSITKSMPPVLLIHGDADRIVPVSQSINVYERLKAHNCKCKLVIVPKDGHCFPNTKSYFNAMNISIKFLCKVLK